MGGGRALAATPGLRSGDRGPDVVWLQMRLAEFGLFSPTATGYFGPVTEAAVRAYQRQVGLYVSGVAGPQTCTHLLADTWKVRVDRGDTLTAVADRHQVSLSELMAANPQVTNPNRIYAGQELIVPGTPGIIRIAATGSSPASVPAGGQTLTPAAPATRPEDAAEEPVAPAPDGRQTAHAQISPGSGVFLTFDGGPDPKSLPSILKILRRHGCRAVFFFFGEQMALYPDLVTAVDAEGHVVGSCGWGSATLELVPESKISTDLASTSKLIADLTGTNAAWYRPPEGKLNEAIACSARRTGHRLVMWQNIGALPDGPDTVGCIDRYLSEATIVRLPGTDTNVEAYLEALLERWEAHGVTILPPSELAVSPAVW